MWTLAAFSSGGLAAQADRFDPKVGDRLTVFYIRRMNRGNSNIGYAAAIMNLTWPADTDLSPVTFQLQVTQITSSPNLNILIRE